MAKTVRRSGSFTSAGRSPQQMLFDFEIKFHAAAREKERETIAIGVKMRCQAGERLTALGVIKLEDTAEKVV